MSELQPRTRNITAAYRAASEYDRADGREWYARARRLAAELDPADPVRGAAVIAVLSPRQLWSVNVKLARAAYDAHRAGSDVAANLPCLGSSARKAAAVLAVPAGDHDALEGIVTGPKVRTFWRVISDPTDPRAVVVDMHALDVACGRVLNNELRGRLLGRVGAYDSVCELYRRAAKILSRELGRTISPAEVQAVTWVYWRRERATGQTALLSRDTAKGL